MSKSEIQKQRQSNKNILKQKRLIAGKQISPITKLLNKLYHEKGNYEIHTKLNKQKGQRLLTDLCVWN